MSKRSPAQTEVDPVDRADHYQQLHRDFVWKLPRRLNIAQLCCSRWAAAAGAAARVAVVWQQEGGSSGSLSYAQLQAQAHRLSHALWGLGVRRDDRVAVVMPQRPQTAVAHMALYQMGAVAMPLSNLFGPEALQYRLQDSAAVLALVDETGVVNLRAARPDCAALRQVVVVGEAQVEAEGEVHWDDALAAAPEGAYPLCDTAADDPAVLIYTSGTTGPPKGALLPHRALIGNLSGFVCSQNWFGADGDEVFWSPADWAWTGGLMDALLPTLYFGRPIVAWQASRRGGGRRRRHKRRSCQRCS